MTEGCDELWCWITIGATLAAIVVGAIVIVLICCCCDSCKHRCRRYRSCCEKEAVSYVDDTQYEHIPDGPSEYCPFCTDEFGSNSDCATCMGKNIETHQICRECKKQGLGRFYRAGNRRAGFWCIDCRSHLILGLSDSSNVPETDLKKGEECITNTGERGTVAYVGNLVDAESEWIGILIRDGGDPTVQPGFECLDGNIQKGTCYFQVDEGAHARMYRRVCVAPMSLIVPSKETVSPSLEQVVVDKYPPHQSKMQDEHHDDRGPGVLAPDSSSSLDGDAVPMHAISFHDRRDLVDLDLSLD